MTVAVSPAGHVWRVKVGWLGPSPRLRDALRRTANLDPSGGWDGVAYGTFSAAVNIHGLLWAALALMRIVTAPVVVPLRLAGALDVAVEAVELDGEHRQSWRVRGCPDALALRRAVTRRIESGRALHGDSSAMLGH